MLQNFSKESKMENSNSNGQSKSVLLSSNATLFWRLFVPIFGSSVLTALLVAFWFSDASESSFNASAVMGIRLLFTLFWLGWLFFVRRTIWRLHRVDATDTHIFVTNYWQTASYPWQDVERFEEKKRLGRRIVNLYLKSSGTLGQKISFLPGSQFDEWQRSRS